MVGIEMMAVLQISFFSLMTITQFNPCFSALVNLFLVNGYNKIASTSHLADPNAPIQAKGLRLFSQFLYNYNFTFLFIVVPMVVSLIAYIFKRKARKHI